MVESLKDGSEVSRRSLSSGRVREVINNNSGWVIYEGTTKQGEEQLPPRAHELEAELKNR